MRTRVCYQPKHGGKACIGDDKDTRDCDSGKHCPSHGYWSVWSSYGECSVKCGKGVQYRFRTCNGKNHGGKDCVGKDKDSRVCDTKIYCPVDGYFTQWSSYGACSVTCAQGTQYRTRTCVAPKHGGKDCVGSTKDSQVCDTKIKCTGKSIILFH